MPATHKFQRVNLEKGAAIDDTTVEIQFLDNAGNVVSIALSGGNAMDLFARLHGVADSLGVGVRKRDG